jgi:hypothetical protein
MEKLSIVAYHYQLLFDVTVIMPSICCVIESNFNNPLIRVLVANNCQRLFIDTII